MEHATEAEKAAASEALDKVAERVLGKAKEAKEEAPFCFFTAKSAGGLTSRLRSMLGEDDDTGCVSCWGRAKRDSTPQMFLLDLEDDGAFYRAEGSEITEASVGSFLEAYRAGTLAKQQLSRS